MTTMESGEGMVPRTDDVHKLVTRRYKELRKFGMDTKEAMTAARAEYGADKNDNADPSYQVAALFGMSVTKCLS